MVTEKPQKTPKYFCINCDFGTDNKKDFRKHTMTSKHSLLTLGDGFSDAKKPKYCCTNCNKTYLSRNGLWNHNKKCTTSTVNNLTNQTKEFHNYTEAMLSVFKDNIKEIMLEVSKNSNVTNNNISNCNNKSFNLQFFLNDTCKDAMNIMDFVNSVQLQLSDLEKVGEVGFVNGISNIIVKNLKTLDVKKRPLHCSDIKREVLYVKDDDKWAKEQDNNPKVRKAIKYIASKNINLLQQFKQVYPQSTDGESKYNDIFNHLVIQALGGLGNEDADNEDKIIHNLSKHLVISKEKYTIDNEP
jgi:hypothetical protein